MADGADLIVAFSNKGVRYDLLHGVENPNKVFVDGSDFQSFSVDSTNLYKAVFKREYNKHCRQLPDGIFPLPFAAERRYFDVRAAERDIFLLFASTLATNVWRFSINQRLQNLCRNDIFAGNTGERAYRKRIGLPIDTPVYRSMLSRARVGVNVAGAGYDCGRYWEILASGSMLFTQELDISIPYPFVDGEHCVVFRSLGEFEEKLDMILSGAVDIESVARNGYEHLIEYHTTAHRAQYFLDCIEKIPDSFPGCVEFYAGKPKRFAWANLPGWRLR
ncbi:MAG: glycosyltransferase [Dechloromonas sp.]|nr:glycosyltransferase [Dechloromonas sp.]